MLEVFVTLKMGVLKIIFQLLYINLMVPILQRFYLFHLTTIRFHSMERILKQRTNLHSGTLGLIRYLQIRFISIRNRYFLILSLMRRAICLLRFSIDMGIKQGIRTMFITRIVRITKLQLVVIF